MLARLDLNQEESWRKEDIKMFYKKLQMDDFHAKLQDS